MVGTGGYLIAANTPFVSVISEGIYLGLYITAKCTTSVPIVHALENGPQIDTANAHCTIFCTNIIPYLYSGKR